MIKSIILIIALVALLSFGFYGELGMSMPDGYKASELESYEENGTSVNTTTWGYEYHLSSGDIVQVGDNTTTDFRASVKTMRGDNVWFSFFQPGTYTPSLDGLTISFAFSANVLVSIYPVEPCERLPSGGIEYDIQLLARPAQNVITLNIDWEGITWQKIYGLDIEYDEAACEEEFGIEDAPYTITPTSIVGNNGTVYKTRHEYEVNSYIGVADSNTKNTSIVGYNSTGYPITRTNVSKTFLYIHRGIMTDALNNTTWVEDIEIDEIGKDITFTLPRDWLKNAEYPVNQVCGLDPAYTQEMSSWDSDTYATDGTWTDYDLYTNQGVPKGAVAEIIIGHQLSNDDDYIGIRTDESGLERRVDLHEAESIGQTNCRLFVVCDSSSGYVETYHEDVSDSHYFYLVGYWENVSFTENNDGFLATSTNTWHDTGAILQANRIHHIVSRIGMLTQGQDEAMTMGVRENDSSLERKLLQHESEGDGSSYLDWLVKADSSGKCEIYAKYTSSLLCGFYDMGYFGDEFDFVECFDQIDLTTADWELEDMSAYLDEDGRLCDFLITHSYETSTSYLGARDGDDTTTVRRISSHEAESAGAGGEYLGIGMTAQSNASGQVYLNCGVASSGYDGVYLTGYFVFGAAPAGYPYSWGIVIG